MNKEEFKKELRVDEGVRRWAYVDTTGNLTIGVGHNLTTKGISPVVMEQLLEEDIEEVVQELDRIAPWWRELDEVRQRALANMGFNLGVKKLIEGFPTSMGAVREKRWNDAGRLLRKTLWYRQVKGRGERVVRMLETGSSEG